MFTLSLSCPRLGGGVAGADAVLVWLQGPRRYPRVRTILRHLAAARVVVEEPRLGGQQFRSVAEITGDRRVACSCLEVGGGSVSDGAC